MSRDDRSRLAAGDDEPVEPVELLGKAHLDRLRAEPPQHGRVLAEVSLHGEDADLERLLHRRVMVTSATRRPVRAAVEPDGRRRACDAHSCRAVIVIGCAAYARAAQQHEPEAEEAERERGRPRTDRAAEATCTRTPVGDRRWPDVHHWLDAEEAARTSPRRRPDDVVDRRSEEADRPVDRPTRPLRRVRDEDEGDGEDRDQREVEVARVEPIQERAADERAADEVEPERRRRADRGPEQQVDEAR